MATSTIPTVPALVVRDNNTISPAATAVVSTCLLPMESCAPVPAHAFVSVSWQTKART